MPNNILNLASRSGYRFNDEPETSLLYQVRIAINRSRLFSWQIQARCDEYITIRTIDNLLNGKTKRPQLRTVQLIMKALGYKLTWTKL